jgi:glycosyltransferase involved in cell wall biosynthesis
MVHYLKAQGHRVCVLTSLIQPGDEPYRKIDEAEEVHRFRFWSEGKILAEYQRIPVARMTTYLASALLLGRRVFSQAECDLIHTHFLLPTGVVGAALAGWLRKPHVLSVHGSDMRMAMRKKVLRPLARWAIARSRVITATAHHQIEPLRMLGAPENRVINMSMGIDEVFVQGANGAPAPRLPKSIISTRSLIESTYNISQLICAMRIVIAHEPEAQLTVAGVGPDREKLEKLTRELVLEDHVRFIGWASPEQLAQNLRQHQLYVSTSRGDGASISLFEAMVSGAYPVLSDIPANREWVRHGENGLLFALDDPPALARMILEALDNPAMMQKATACNRETALKNFTWPAIARRLEALYRTALQME